MEILNVNSENIEAVLAKVRRMQEKSPQVDRSVREIIVRVRSEGDAALFDLTAQFDDVRLKNMEVGKEEIKNAYAAESAQVINALTQAKRNIEKFHSKNLIKKEQPVETQKGVEVWREWRPIEKVGLYVPGGKAAYLSTVLMLGVPAKIAGCREIILCVPPDKTGNVPSAVLIAADLCGISKIYKVGGAQAIAAMAYGTETIPRVSKIFGPGNQYVTTAKLLVYGEVDIDMPAGPSEVLVFADNSADPAWIAADLLSQLEHGEDSQAILVTADEAFAKIVMENLDSQ